MAGAVPSPKPAGPAKRVVLSALLARARVDDSARAPSAAPRSTAFDADEPFRFGKFKGSTFREVSVLDPQYLGWYYRTEKEKAKNGVQFCKTAAWVGGFRAFIKSLSPARDDVAPPSDATPQDHGDDLPYSDA